MMKTTISLFAFLIAAVVLLFTSCKDDNPVNGYPKDVTVEYKYTVASGTPHDIEINYTNESGGTARLTGVALPLTKKITLRVNVMDDVTTSFSGLGPGGIKGEIYVDGKLVQTKTASSNVANSAFYEVISYIWR
jgi:predicted small secreted protein